MREVRVLSTVDEAARTDLSGCAVAVIDVLRATTSMAYMFSSGAKAICPVGEVEAAREQRLNMPGALLCGERNGVPPEGFDMGNSPAEFKEADLSGKEMILTTTNGTQAVACAMKARLLVAVACVNAAAVARYICENTEIEPVYLLCAGTQGRFSIEDFYCAGLVASHIRELCKANLDDFSWAAAKLTQLPVSSVVNAGTCKHLAFLLESGFKTDIELALSTEHDGSNIAVPLYDRDSGCFVPVN